MSRSPATHAQPRPRPLSPHLSIYKPTITMVMSVFHRLTGMALYGGTALVALWLSSAAGSQSYYDAVNAIYNSWFGRLVLLVYTWVLLHHMLGGIRHLIWDTGAGLDKPTATRFGWMTLIGSLALTVVIWIVGYMVRGGQA